MYYVPLCPLKGYRHLHAERPPCRASPHPCHPKLRPTSAHADSPPTFVTALDKLGMRHLFANSAPEPVQVNAAFDIASLILYGCQALPIRLKILLDRLFSVLRNDQVVRVLHGFGWTPDDYSRGYILQVIPSILSWDLVLSGC